MGGLIPEDVKAAREAYISVAMKSSPDEWTNDEVRAVAAQAIMAERQRCADVAKRVQKENDTGSGFDSQPARVTAYKIRRAILKLNP